MSKEVNNESRRDPMVFETLTVRQEGAVLFAQIAAPPMNLLAKGGASCATIQCHHHRDRSGGPVFDGAVCGRGHDSRESAADAPETDGVFHLVGARIQQICLSI